MQIVLERGSIDTPSDFNIGLLQLIFHTTVFANVFNPNILPNSAEGLHFSAFHLFMISAVAKKQ